MRANLLNPCSGQCSTGVENFELRESAGRVSVEKLLFRILRARNYTVLQNRYLVRSSHELLIGFIQRCECASFGCAFLLIEFGEVCARFSNIALVPIVYGQWNRETDYKGCISAGAEHAWSSHECDVRARQGLFLHQCRLTFFPLGRPARQIRISKQHLSQGL